MNTATALHRQSEIKRCMPMVHRIARQVSARVPASVAYDDLVQSGMLGLTEASLRFDPASGVPFEAFASSRVRGAITDELRGNDWLTRGHRRERRAVDEKSRLLSQRLGREPSVAEVALEMGLAADDIHEIIAEADVGRPISLLSADDPDESFIEENRADQGADPSIQYVERRLRADLASSMARLPERERLVMSLYYEQELNLREIAAVLDVTESRVCQIHRQAVERLQVKLSGWRATETVRRAA